jgi:hypothetical protein
MKSVVLLLILALVAAAGLFLWGAPPSDWTGVSFAGLAFIAACAIAGLLRAWLRDAFVVVASLCLGLVAIEAYLAVTHAGTLEVRTPGYSVSRPILGWGPEHAGVFHLHKMAPGSRATVFDVDYTIDANLLRRTEASASGPLVAFFGDSLTFGTGLPDKATLPQQFADLYDRKIGVLNAGFPGYGPQQFLRAQEMGLFDPLLRGRVKLFVYETAVWHAERSSCIAGFMLRAPRYVLEKGVPTYEGACYQNWAHLPVELATNVMPGLAKITPADVDLYVAILGRAAALSRDKYGAPTLIVYLPADPGYLRRIGLTDADIMDKMRKAGLQVIDAGLDPAAYPDTPLAIPGDGHPTAKANALRAAMIKDFVTRTYPGLL